MFRASTIGEDVIQKLAAELTGALTDNGQRDLRACRLVDLEAEVMEASTRLARATLGGALKEQAEQVPAAECCPACGGPLQEKPPQAKTLKTQAGRVGWRQTVQRCPACRRDFFPSDASVGL
jgi:uncharacterized protein with PIN domain